MFKPLLIHKDNTPLSDNFTYSNSIKFSIDNFDFGNSDLDSFISQEFIPKLNQKDFNIVFIKDNLSDNYLELYGLTLAYHIRLNESLESKRFIPIVILSDVDGYILNKLTPLANILFTKNIFVAKNELASYQYFEKVFDQITALSEDEYPVEFLNKIEIEPPKDTSGTHDIANKWSIYRWAEILDVNSVSITKNREELENHLYFRYLKALHTLNSLENITVEEPKEKGKVLLIDDEWNKGWKDIVKKSISKEGIDFRTFEYNFQDKSKFNLYMQIQNQVKDFDPDVIILDLRLSQSDHESDDIDNYTGIKILEKIHKINAGIQVIMLTATSKSTILEKLYEKNILGYIKKEHPEDKSIDTVENINKFIGLVDKGLERKYLKKIWTLQKDILKLDLLQITFSFNLSDQEKKLLELKNNLSRVFETLDSDIPKPFVYGMLIIYKCIEIICDYYIYEDYDRQERKRKAYWIENDQIIDNNGNTSVNNKIKSILRQLNIEKQERTQLIDQLSCSRNFEIHSGEIKRECENNVIQNINESHILEWFSFLNLILNQMDVTDD